MERINRFRSTLRSNMIDKDYLTYRSCRSASLVQR